jgi:hypothetical protein
MHISAMKNEASCKICGHLATLDTLVDFNKYCDFENPNRTLLPLSGIPVWYHRCVHCGLVFTEAFDCWGAEEFNRYIYNNDYVTIDPEFHTARPSRMLSWLKNNVQRLSDHNHLDYGGGNGLLSELIRPVVRSSRSWDPFMKGMELKQSEVFSLITAFEVIEHSPTPVKTAQHLMSLLGVGGELILSTVTHSHPETNIINRWYISPRNGHVTIYSDYSLDLLFGQDVSIEHYGHCIHRVRKL